LANDKAKSLGVPNAYGDYRDMLKDDSKDMCPQTKDIMMRLATIAITPDLDSDWVTEKATEINTKFKKIFGE